MDIHQIACIAAIGESPDLVPMTSSRESTGPYGVSIGGQVNPSLRMSTSQSWPSSVSTTINRADMGSMPITCTFQPRSVKPSMSRGARMSIGMELLVATSMSATQPVDNAVCLNRIATRDHQWQIVANF